MLYLVSLRSNDWARARFTHFQWLPVTFPFHYTKFPRSTSYTRAISSSVLSPIILPHQTFFSQVLLLRQQAFFIRKSFPREADGNNYSDKNTSLRVLLWARKFAKKIHYCSRDCSLLKKIYKRDAPVRAVFKVKALAVLFPPYPSEMKTNTVKFNLPPFCRLLFTSWYDVSHAMGFRGWGRNSIKNHSLTHSLTPLLDN